MAITSVDVNRDALNRIKGYTGIKSDREVINTAIEEKLAREQQKEFLKLMSEHPLSDDELHPRKVDYPL